MKKISNLPGLIYKTIQGNPLELSVVPTSRILNDTETGRSPFRPFKALSYLLIYCTGDAGFHHVDFTRYPCEKGSLLIISKEQIHFFDPRMPVEGFLIVFSGRFLEQSCGPGAASGTFTLFEHHLYSPQIQLNKENEPKVSSLVYQLKETFDSETELFCESLLEAWLKALLYRIEQVRVSAQIDRETLYYRKDFARLLELLEMHLFENRQVQFYADLMQVSTKKLNRITHEVVRQPAKNYINELFLLKTRRLLVNRALSVKEISFRTGFDAPTNFVKFFKTHTGTTPAEFRRQY